VNTATSYSKSKLETSLMDQTSKVLLMALKSSSNLTIKIMRVLSLMKQLAKPLGNLLKMELVVRFNLLSPLLNDELNTILF